MAATRGKDAWEKHFRGRGNVQTTMGKKSKQWDIETKKDTMSVLEQGTQITVIGTEEYDNKPIVEYGEKRERTRVTFDCIQKPGTSRSSSSPNQKANDKTIRNKTLAPSGLGLNGAKIKKDAFIKTVSDALVAKKDIKPSIKKLCLEILAKSEKTGQKVDSLEDISDKDLAIIGKDFGEFSGAWWFINNFAPEHKLNMIEYPASVSNALADYSVHDGFKYMVSAKYKKGAVPSISNIREVVNGMTPENANDKKAKELILSITDSSNKEGIVVSAKLVNSEAYQILCKIMKDKNLTDKKIEDYLQTFKNFDALYSFISKEFYSKIGKDAKVPTIKSAFSPGKSRSGIITSPLAYATIDEINKNKIYTNFLTRACQSLEVHQIYFNITRQGILQYNVKKFEEESFIFEYHSNAAKPGGNKIGFELVK
jgi:hypothetical protein